METLTPALFSGLSPFPKFGKTLPKSARSQFLHFSRGSGGSSGMSRPVISMELGNHNDGKVDQFTDCEKEDEKKDISKLFKEAQQNILYLNRQRLLATEELHKLKKEKNTLLDRLEELEMKVQARNGKDNLSIISELLLRIDSMVLTGVIGSNEALDIRKFVMDARGSLLDGRHDILGMNDSEILAELRHLSEKSKRNGFHVVHICTEMFPVVSVGSLATYITGLSCALQRRGIAVEVILPKYACLNLEEVQGLREVQAEFYSYFNGQLHENRIWTGIVYGIGVTFIQPIYYSSLFSQERVYGYPNDIDRFSYFSRAALDYLVKSGKRPDVLHVHNWQTSIVGPLFWDVHVNQGLDDTRILLSCQSFDSQCLEQPEKLALCGLDASRLHRLDRLQDNNKPHLVNILKGGLVYSNKVVIMSSLQPKRQIINALGHGLEATLTVHNEKLVIAPCGFDKSAWDPSRDNLLPQSYSMENMTGKSICKVALQQHLKLTLRASEVLVGCICSDLSDADLDKLKSLVWMASRMRVQFAFMISCQNPGMNRSLNLFQQELEDDKVRFVNKYDEELSHLIISGSDIMLCPSFDDPVLQVPLKALTYGTAPVPLNFKDTMFRHLGDQHAESTKCAQYMNDTFGNMTLGQAIDELLNSPSQWRKRMMDAMSKDFSWDAECSDVHISAYESLKRL